MLRWRSRACVNLGQGAPGECRLSSGLLGASPAVREQAEQAAAHRQQAGRFRYGAGTQPGERRHVVDIAKATDAHNVVGVGDAPGDAVVEEGERRATRDDGMAKAVDGWRFADGPDESSLEFRSCRRSRA
jgi:hypothetical protein